MDKRILRRLLRPIVDPIYLVNGFLGYWQYFLDWKRYSRLPHVEKIRFIDSYPQLHDRTAVTPFDAHYFFTNGWAMRRISSTTPSMHVDIGSQIVFSSLLSAHLPVLFLDYRPLRAKIQGLHTLSGDLLCLPFTSRSIRSLSCLHVVEHIGLGRYGDTLDPAGTQKAMRELERVLAPGGNLFVATPVGKPTLAFNAHRIHAPDVICALVPELKLMEFSGVNDRGEYQQHMQLPDLAGEDYACGLYWFTRE